jgi:hypothetical protein
MKSIKRFAFWTFFVSCNWPIISWNELATVVAHRDQHDTRRRSMGFVLGVCPHAAYRPIPNPPLISSSFWTRFPSVMQVISSAHMYHVSCIPLLVGSKVMAVTNYKLIDWRLHVHGPFVTSTGGTTGMQEGMFIALLQCAVCWYRLPRWHYSTLYENWCVRLMYTLACGLNCLSITKSFTHNAWDFERKMNIC